LTALAFCNNSRRAIVPNTKLINPTLEIITEEWVVTKDDRVHVLVSETNTIQCWNVHLRTKSTIHKELEDTIVSLDLEVMHLVIT
jgi:hypothetical protein